MKKFLEFCDGLIEAIKKAEQVIAALVLLVLGIGTLLTAIKVVIESLF